MLDDLELFIKLVDVGSFGSTAKIIDSTQATISRRIQALESKINMTLIKRDSRTFEITDNGKILYEQCKQSVESLKAAWQNVSEQLHQEMQGTLRLVLTTESAKNILLQQLPQFLSQYPQAKLHVSFTRQRINLVKQRYDIAITSSLLESTSHQIKPLGKLYYKLYASPKYIAKYGLLKNIADLSKHRCIGILSTNGEEQNNYLIHQINTKQDLVIHYASNLYMDTISQCIEVAKSGEYMIGAWDLIVKEEVEHGELIQILSQYVLMEQPCYLIRKIGTTNKLEQKLAQFIEEVFNCK